MSDELLDLPEGWSEALIIDIGMIMSGQTPKGIDGSSVAHGIIPWFRVGNMNEPGNEEILTTSEVKLTSDKVAALGLHIRPKGTIVFPKRGGAIATNKKRILGQPSTYDLNLMGIFPIGIYNKYFWYWFQLIDLKQLSDGSNVPQINHGDIEHLTLPIPPLNEQKRIVAKIEELSDRSQTAQKALETIPQLCDRFRQSVLAAAFRGDLTADWREKNPDVEPASVLLGESSDNLPSTWYFISVGHVIDSLKYGTSQKCSYEVEGVPVLRIPNIGSGIIDHSDLKYAELPQKEFEELSLKSGDILLIRSNGSVSLVGKTAVVRDVEEGFAYAGYLIRLRINKFIIDPIYLHLCLSSAEIRLQIEIPAKSTSGVHNINSQEVKKLRISLPPLAEQKQIVSLIEKYFKIIETIEKQHQQATEKLERLNQSILSKAFRGELVPQDPEDEPASVLLERIRAEREKLNNSKPKSTSKRKSKTPKEQGTIPGLE